VGVPSRRRQVRSGLYKAPRAVQDDHETRWRHCAESGCFSAGVSGAFSGLFLPSILRPEPLRPQMDCTAAAHRLRVGVPATVEHAAEENGGNGADMAKQVAETTQVRPRPSSCAPTSRTCCRVGRARLLWASDAHDPLSQNFITFMDALKLKLRAKDQLHPLLTDLMSGYTRFKNSNEWEGRPKILHWCVGCAFFVVGIALFRLESASLPRSGIATHHLLLFLLGSSPSTKCAPAKKSQKSSLDKFVIPLPPFASSLPTLTHSLLFADALRRRARLLRVRSYFLSFLCTATHPPLSSLSADSSARFLRLAEYCASVPPFVVFLGTFVCCNTDRRFSLSILSPTVFPAMRDRCYSLLSRAVRGGEGQPVSQRLPRRATAASNATSKNVFSTTRKSVSSILFPFPPTTETIVRRVEVRFDALLKASSLRDRRGWPVLVSKCRSLSHLFSCFLASPLFAAQ
jgi:hypothetical protein